MLKIEGLDALVVGRFGGGSLEGKLQASLGRGLKLLKVVKARKPDLAVSFSSPEAARVAFGLSIPHFCVNDSPHAEAVARLTIPLSVKLFTPKCIPLERWLKFGIDKLKIVQYDAVDPAAWLKGFIPSFKTCRRKLIVARVEEAYASYMREAGGGFVEKVVRELRERYGGEVDIIVLARYLDQVRELKVRLSEVAYVPPKAPDTLKLLPKACLFIGGGGTMTWEAALMGIPTLSCIPLEGVDVENYMVQLGLIRKVRSVEEGVEEAVEILENLEVERKVQRGRAEEALAKMENPVEAVASHIEKFLDRLA